MFFITSTNFDVAASVKMVDMIFKINCEKYISKINLKIACRCKLLHMKIV